STDLSIKQLDLLRQAVPRASRSAVLWNPDNPYHPVTVGGLKRKKPALGLQLQFLGVRSPDEFEDAFNAMITAHAHAVLILSDPLTLTHRRRLAELATNHRLAAMGSLKGYPEAGGLLSYWADGGDLFRKVASYVDRILKGAKPADLPVEQP